MESEKTKLMIAVQKGKVVERGNKTCMRSSIQRCRIFTLSSAVSQMRNPIGERAIIEAQKTLDVAV